MASANIFSQYLQPIRSVADYRADMDAADLRQTQLQGARRKNAMEEMAFGQAQRKQNALQQIAAGWTPQTTMEDRISSLRSNPLTFGEADALEKSMLERKKTGAEVRDKESTTAERLLKLSRDAVSTVVANPTPEALEATIAHLESVTGKPAAQTRALFAGATTPDDIRNRAMRIGLELEKQLPKTGNENLGGNMAYTSRDPITGAVTTNSMAPITQGADNAATNARTAADAAANRAVQMRGQNMTDARERERLAFDLSKPTGAAAKPMPAAALKMQDEDLNAIGTFAGIDADLAGIEKQIADGRLRLGPASNVVGQVRNYLGKSDENSRNLATFKAKLENMRNAVLLLNKGVQTEGDAQRAMNEMMSNINDPDVVKQRLAEIRALNRRAVMLKKNNVDMVRRNYQQEDMDFSRYEQQPAATNLNDAPATSFSDAEKERRYQEWKAKQK